MIGLHQQGMVGFSDEMIGETAIDLEDRFYSKCYAMCGLPEVYVEAGLNRWRDSRSPTQILQLLCRQNHMPQPVYRFEAGNELCVYIENPGLRGLRARTGRETEETFRYAMREVSEEEEEAGDGRSGSFIEGTRQNDLFR